MFGAKKFICPHNECGQIIKKPRISLPAQASFSQVVCPCPICNQQILWVRIDGDTKFVRLVAIDDNLMVNESLARKFMHLSFMAVSQICARTITWRFDDDSVNPESEDEEDLNEVEAEHEEDYSDFNIAGDDTLLEDPGPITAREVADITWAIRKSTKAKDIAKE